MPAIDTIASFQTTVGSTFAEGVMASGDSSAIRNFPDAAQARLVAAYSDHVGGTRDWRIRSPLLHDTTQGIRFIPGQSPAIQLLPPQVSQELHAQDDLTLEFSTLAATGKALGALLIYYSQLPGVMARLFNPGDVFGLVKAIKPVLVTPASGANTAGAWFDSLLTDDEDLLHANVDYAVLGIVTDVALAAVAIKGIDTGNLRIGVPGILDTKVTSDYFVQLSLALGLPCIPVINAANAKGVQVSIISAAATTAVANVQVILAELAQNLG